MNRASVAMRGRPLIMLGLVLIVWVAARIAMWELPFALDTPTLGSVPFPVSSMDSESVSQPRAPFKTTPNPSLLTREIPDVLIRELPVGSAAPQNWQEGHSSGLIENPDIAGGHQLLWMAAMAHLPIPQELHQRVVVPPLPDGKQPTAISDHDRWSLDAWTFLRDGAGGSSIAQGRVPSYGASQAAAVLRYRLAPQNRHDPRAYIRAYQALIEGGESEIAFGLSARPMANIPVRAHAEVRVTDRINEVDLRPAAFVTSELPPIALPARLRVEPYVQAGYVSGEGKTAFADGQIHLMRDVEKFDLGRVSLGGAAWGGVQEGARRLDIGPSLRVDIELENAPARLVLDYRERVAGNAQPHSGVAFTVSSRF